MKQKFIALYLLQCKLQNFDYGPDSDSKPIDAFVQTRSLLTVKTTAAEMIVLVRYFGLMFGKYVPEENDSWKLFLNLRSLLDKLLNTNFTNGNIEQARHLVAEHNELYKDLAKTTLKPKHHFMTHYGSMIRKFGPLTQTWTMRFEARHKIAELAARSSSSRRNICKTIAIKNQLILNHLFLKKDLFKKNLYSATKRKLQLKVKQRLPDSFKFLDDREFFSVLWVKKLGQTFRINDIITTAMSNIDLPLFARIQKIVIDSQEDDVYFEGHSFESIYFDTHFHAFEVEEHNVPRTQWFELKNLISLAPNTLTLIDSQQFITQRFPID